MYRYIFSLAFISLLTFSPFVRMDAYAAPPTGAVVVPADTVWPEGDYQLDSLSVENGATLSIAGGSTLNVAGGVSVTGNSVILLQSKDNVGQVNSLWQGRGVTMTAAAVQIDAGSKISADGQGYVGTDCSGAGNGPGGGQLNCNNNGNGGSYGGIGFGPNSSSMTTYGSQFQPVDLGSGGSGGFLTGSGGAGGGAIRLIVSGLLTNNGVISANGANASGASGAGSGGSVYVTVNTLAGSGIFSANGGGSSSSGGGGRVAVYFQANNGFSSSGSTAIAGSGGVNGTVIFVDSSHPNSSLFVDQQFSLDQNTVITYDSITVNNGATLKIGGGSNITVVNGITVTGNSTILLQSKDNVGQVNSLWQGRGVTMTAATVQVDVGSKISADGQGYVGNNCSGGGSGPGGGVLHCNNNGNGGSYGGIGFGPNSSSMTTYGFQFQPVDLGSGGSGGFLTGPGGAGGGAIRLIVSGTLTNNGVISANGGNASGASGGGSGGSVYVTANTLAGSGLFSANGGVSSSSGGGGRMAVYYQTLIGFNTTGSTATAGSGGENGTVIFVDSSRPNSSLYIDKLFSLDQNTVATFDSITVNNGATLKIGGGSNITVVNGITVAGNSTILLQSKDNVGQVNSLWQGQGAAISASNILVDAGSRISADGQGYVGNNCSGGGSGPGGGVLHCNNNGNGGSYGGIGFGPNSSSMTTYGSQFQPVDLGSGGSGGFQTGSGGAGGGAIRLTVSGTLTNNGVISANGGNASGASGGGSGGSIYATVNTLAGSGVFSANGGVSSSGGGGGRVAVYFKSRSGFDFTTTTAAAGTGGGDGTVVFIDNSGVRLRLYVDRLFRFSQDTTATYDFLNVNNGALVTIGGGSDLTFLNGITVSGNSTVLFQSKGNTGQINGLWQSKGSSISASGIQIDSGSRLTADAQGYSGNNCSGPGSGPGGGPLFCNNSGNGGSNGGKGASSNSAVMTTYGSRVAPVDPGSGGSGGFQTGSGGAGGGTIRLLVSSALVNNGIISANGGNASGYSGAGSGGSVFVNAGSLSGSGVFTANGGVSDNSGGGGRVAVYYASDNGFTGIAGSTAAGGNGTVSGQAGTVLFSTDTSLFVWLQPTGVLLHDTVRLEGGALALDASSTTVELTATGNNQQFRIASQLPILFGQNWDTRTVPDGSYELRLICRDLGGQVVREATRAVEINNSVQWHAGAVTTDQTWGSDKIHVVEGTVVVSAGAHVTIAPGTIIKVSDGSRIIVADSGFFDAQGTAEAHIVITSVNDVSIGGNTNLGGGEVMAIPGSWYGITVQGNGQANLNGNTELRYARSDRSGTIAGSESWLGTYVYHVTGNITIPSGVTLTIKPGAVVKFDPFTGITVQPGGQLIANGTVPQPIFFTSIKDDAVGGDTNGDGNATAPTAGDWQWLYIDGAQASFDHVVVSYGGGTSSGQWDGTGVIRSNGDASVSFSNSMIKDAFFDGILAWGGTASVRNSIFTGISRAVSAHPGSTVNVTNCTLDNNQIGLLVHGGTLKVANSIVTNSGAAGLQYDFGTLDSVTYTDIWNPTTSSGARYLNNPDVTGTNGNISADPLYQNRQQLDYRPGYRSPCIDAADGSQAPDTDAMGAPRYDDPRTANSGVPLANGSFPDMGALEFVETAESNIDLIVSSVSGPLSATPGDLVNVSWTITNIGEGSVVGPWHDAIYLVRNPDGKALEISAGEALVGQSMLLGPGQSYTATATVRVPGSVVGNHRWGVKTNVRGELFEGKNGGNNTRYSAALVAVDLTELLVGTAPLSRQFSAVGERHWFKITPGAGRDVGLNLALSGTAGTTRILVGQGYLPDPQHYDVKENEWISANTTALIADTSTQTYYVTVYPQSLGSGSANYTLSATTLDFSLGSVNPGSVSNSGMTTLTLSGGRLKDNAVYRIVGPDGITHNAAAIFIDNSSRVFATFDMSGLQQGAYTVQVVEDGKTVSAANALNVASGSAGQIEYNLEVPTALRPGWSGQVTVNYRNAGSSDAVAPLIRLEAIGTTINQIAPPCRGCSAALQQVYGTIFDSGYLLGISRSGPAGILPPGGSGSITLNITPTIDEGTISFVLHTVTNPDTSFNWDGLKESMRPYYVPADAWDAIYANFRSVVGSSIGQYNTTLANDATYLSRLGVYEQNVNKLFTFEMLKAGLREISQRYTVGSFGRGTGHPLDKWGEFRNGKPVIHYPNGTVREFFADPANAGRYLGGIGDYGRVVFNQTDQSLTLNEKEGLQESYIPDPGITGRYILSQRKDLNGNVKTLSYSAGRLAGITDVATGDAYSFSYNSQGRISQQTDPVGRVTSYSYDAAGEHLSSVTDARGTTGYSYISGQGAPGEHALQSVTYPDGTHVNLEYDARGRVIKRYRDNGSELLTFSYAATGEITVQDAAGNISRILPDANNRTGQFIDPLERVTQLFYNIEDRLTDGIAPSGAAISLEYDSQGNTNVIRDPLGNQTNIIFTSYGRILSMTNGAASSVNYAYDGKFNNNKITYPDGSYAQYGYDSQGNPVSHTDRSGRSIAYTYDSKRQLTRKSYADGSHVDFTYDNHRNLLSATGSGGTTSFSYDAADRLTGITYPGGRSLQYLYDAGGRRSQVKDGSGFTVNYLYDSVGRLSQVNDGSGTMLITYGYDAAGRLVRKDMGNATYTVYAYDQNGRVLHLTNYGSGGLVNSRFDYSYDADGRKSGVSTLDGVWSYGYDAAGQLVTVVKPDLGTIRYSYDSAGNRESVTNNSAETNYSATGGDAYTNVGTSVYSYDLNGNVISKVDGANSWTYSYDDENRLTSMSTPTGSWSYEYDSLGNRMAQTHDGLRSEYLIDPTGMSSAFASFDGSGTVVNHYVYGLDLSASVTSSGTAAFYHFDDSANTVQVSGAAGTVLNSYSYLPFGEKVLNSESVANPFTYAGRYGVMDDGSGLYFMRNRWYDPAIGRFTRPDPIGISGGDINFYRYVHNNPLNLQDPLGLDETSGKYDTALTLASGESTILSVGATALQQMSPNAATANVFSKAGSVFNVAGAMVSSAQLGNTYNKYYAGQATGWDVLHDWGVMGNSLIGFIPGWGTYASAGISLIDATSLSLATNYYNNQAIQNANNPDIWGPAARAHFPIVKPKDPNDKLTVGYGSEGFIAEGVPITYAIDFENVSSASAAAQQVVITDTLDANLDWSTVELLQIAFNNVTVSVPGGLQTFSGAATVATDPYPVKVAASFNPTTGQLVWTIQSIDQATGTLPRDPYAGFLPPNDASRRGQGSVRFTVKPKSGLAGGTTITNQASIVFDVNDPIMTNVVTNTIDRTNPSSSVAALPSSNPVSFVVTWGGSDSGGSGVAHYDVYVSTDGGGFSLWLTGTTQTSGTFTGIAGHSYGFFSVALDNVGNRSAVPSVSQAGTTVAKHDGVINPTGSRTAPDISDALKVFQYVSGLATLTAVEQTHADVAPLDADFKPQGDGIVDVGDVVIILRKIVGAVNW